MLMKAINDGVSEERIATVVEGVQIEPVQVHQFAELAGVTVKALHHYDRLGLLKPRRTDSGYRLYTERDLERLEQIVALKFLGSVLSLAIFLTATPGPGLGPER